MPDLIPIKRALISVSDKTDLVGFARQLADHDVRLISTGGTARALAEAGLDVIRVEEVTGFPEMMDGRVKTLHPKIHGGLLGRRDQPDHVTAMEQHGMEPIDLVCVNLYPFEETVGRPETTDEEAIEQIDIGGPSMVRSAAKNHIFVTVVTDPSQYQAITDEMDANDGETSLALRKRLATAAFTLTAGYDLAISSWMSTSPPETPSEQSEFGKTMLLRYTRSAVLRYGENPHQDGALYLQTGAKEPAVSRAQQKHGKGLSFCNLYDADGALELVKEIDPSMQAAAAVIKHANPCGFAVADDLSDAFSNAYAGDPLAAYGGILACNQTIEHETAIRIVEVQGLDVIIAPAFGPDALDLLRKRWKNTRLLEVGPLPSPTQREPGEVDHKRITGGLLLQQRDLVTFDASSWEHRAGPAPTDEDCAELRLAMITVKHLKSNAVCLVKRQMLIGAGAGQMDRVASCRIAVEKAGDRARHAFAASDGLFPFRDGPDHLIAAGVKGIVQPGGSKRDDETIQACNDTGVTLLFTGRRHFRH